MIILILILRLSCSTAPRDDGDDDTILCGFDNGALDLEHVEQHI